MGIARLLMLAATAACAASAAASDNMLSTARPSPAPTPPRRAFGRRLQRSEGGGWACQAGEDTSTSCCGAVPEIFAVFTSNPSCASHFPAVAVALGIANPSDIVPGVSAVPHTPGALTTALDAWCPSLCARSVANIVAKYRTRDALGGRLCPQVLDGLWRLDSMCDREGPGNASGDYCLPTYAEVYDAFSATRAATTEAELDTLCSSKCAMKVTQAAVRGSASIAKSLVSADPTAANSTQAELVRFAAGRASAVTHMLSLLCSRDPSTNGYCVVETNVLGRPDISLASPNLISPAPPAAAADATVPTEAAARLLEETADAPVAPAGPGLPAAPTDAPPTPADAPPAEPTDAAAAGSGDAIALAAPPASDLDDADDFNTLMQPARRPGFACTACGRAVLNGLLQLADIFAVDRPAGEANPSARALEAVMADACGTSEKGRTCVALMTAATPASAGYDQALGLAAQSLSLCAEFASQAASAAEAGIGYDGLTCPSQCAYALQGLAASFGCCTSPWLRMQEALGASQLPRPRAFIEAAAARCGVASTTLGANCTASLRRYVAVRLTNLRPSFARSATAGPSFRAALASDLSRAAFQRGVYPGVTGASPAAVAAGGGVLSVVDVRGEGDDSSTVAVLAVTTAANFSSPEVVTLLQGAFSAGDLPLPDVAALVAAAAATSPSPPLLDAAAPIGVADATASYAPAAQPSTQTLPEGSSGAMAVTAGTGSVLIAAALALATAFAGRSHRED